MPFKLIKEQPLGCSNAIAGHKRRRGINGSDGGLGVSSYLANPFAFAVTLSGLAAGCDGTDLKVSVCLAEDSLLRTTENRSLLYIFDFFSSAGPKLTHSLAIFVCYKLRDNSVNADL